MNTYGFRLILSTERREEFMTLYDGKVKHTYQVLSIDIDIGIKRRLEAIGLIEQTKVEIVNQKRNGSIIIRVRGTRWAIGKTIAKGITVKEEN